MNNRLYVENLAPGITDAGLRDLFSKKGQVIEIKLVLDPATGRSNGRAYVTMATPELAAAFVVKARRIAMSLELAVFHRLGAPPDGLGLPAGIAPRTAATAMPCD